MGQWLKFWQNVPLFGNDVPFLDVALFTFVLYFTNTKTRQTQHRMKSTILKISIILYIFLSSLHGLYAQVAINETGSDPDASSILDISSNNKGLLVPRLTTIQRNAIASPATGLLVFDTDTETFWYKEASVWVEIKSGNAGILTDVDNDTKIEVEQNADEDKIRFSVGGNEALHIDESGNVGIGKEPTSPLDIDVKIYDSSPTTVINQSSGTNTISANQYVTQTFKSTCDCKLSIVRLLVATTTTIKGITIYNGANTLSSKAITANSGWNTAYFSDVELVNGETYTIRINNGNQLKFSNSNPYNDGVMSNGAAVASGSDLAFTITVLQDVGDVSFGNNGLTLGEYTLPYSDGSNNQVLTSDGAGNISWSNNLDNLGNHTATQNIQLDGNWLSNDGGNEGIYVETDGKVKVTDNIKLNGNWLSNDGGNEGIYVETDGKIKVADNIKLNGNWLSNDGGNEGIYVETDGKIKVADNIKLNGNWLSNDGGNEGIYVETDGTVKVSNNINLNGKWITGGVGNSGINIAAAGDIYMNRDLYIAGETTISNSESGSTQFALLVRNLSNSSTGYSNGIKIIAGANSYNNNANSRYIGFYKPNGTFMGSIRQDGNSTVKYATSSDIRLKTNIQPTIYGLDSLMQIKVVDYNFKNDLDRIQTGFLAQDLYKHFPEAVSKGGNNAKENPWTVDYGRVTPLLVKAIQEQQVQIETKDAKIAKLEAQLARVNQQTASIINRLEALEQASTTGQSQSTK